MGAHVDEAVRTTMWVSGLVMWDQPLTTVVGASSTPSQARTALTGAQLSSYLSLVPIISTFMIVFVMLVTVLVVALLVTTMLVQTRRELGIKKAVGFTNRELSVQTRWTYLPAIGIGAAAGAVAGAFALSPLLQVLLGQIGVVKVGVAASWVMTAGIALLVVAIGVAVLWASSLRIGRVSAYALVTE